MFQEFLSYHLNKAKYELIENGKTYYGEIPQLKGVWATGKSLEDCRQNLLETMEGWIVLRIKKNLSIPNLKLTFGRIPTVKFYVKA